MRDFDNFDKRFDQAERSQRRWARFVGFGIGMVFVMKLIVFGGLVYAGYQVITDPSLIGWAAGRVVSGFEQGAAQ